MKQTDRIALQNWEKFKDNIARATPVDRSMSQAEIQKHRAWLEARPLEWIKFFSFLFSSQNGCISAGMTDFIAALADLILPELVGGYAPEYVRIFNGNS